jgi:hypothetical protein
MVDDTYYRSRATRIYIQYITRPDPDLWCSLCIMCTYIWYFNLFLLPQGLKPGFFRLYAQIDYEFVNFTEMDKILPFFRTYLVYIWMWCVLPCQNDPLTRNLHYFRHIHLKGPWVEVYIYSTLQKQPAFP